MNQLTNRNKEIIKYVLKGWTNQEIADYTETTKANINYHLNTIYRVLKFKKRKRFQLIKKFTGVKC